jgi:hypothetical protein
MFKSLEKKAYTIKIGNDATAANYNIPTQGDVLPFLEQVLTAPKAAAETV